MPYHNVDSEICACLHTSCCHLADCSCDGLARGVKEQSLL